MNERVEAVARFLATAEEVWAAFSDPERLSDWFDAVVTESELRPGGRLTIRTPDGVTRRALVEDAVYASRLRFRWLPIEEAPDGAVYAVRRTTVEIRLEEDPAGTTVRVVESIGFAAAPELMHR